MGEQRESEQDRANALAKERDQADERAAKAQAKAAEDRDEFKVEGYAIYERPANTMSHLFLDYNSSKEDAERQFRRLHEKSAGQPADYAIVKFSQVATSDDYYEHPDRYELDEDVPRVDRRS